MSLVWNIGSQRVIQARIENEKDDALCPQSQTNVHFYMQRYDAMGFLVPLPKRLCCEACGCPIKQKNSRWVLDRYIIDEVDDIEDLM